MERFGVVASLTISFNSTCKGRDAPNHPDPLEASAPSPHPLQEIAGPHPRRNSQHSDQAPILPFCAITVPPPALITIAFSGLPVPCGLTRQPRLRRRRALADWVGVQRRDERRRRRMLEEMYDTAADLGDPGRGVRCGCAPRQVSKERLEREV